MSQVPPNPKTTILNVAVRYDDKLIVVFADGYHAMVALSEVSGWTKRDVEPLWVTLQAASDGRYAVVVWPDLPEDTEPIQEFSGIYLRLMVDSAYFQETFRKTQKDILHAMVRFTDVELAN